MKWNSYLYLLTALLLISCGKKSVETNRAPTTLEQIGVIASCTTKAQALEIATESGTQFRVINEKKKLMEFIGLSQSQLAKMLPRAKFKPNKMYEDIVSQGSVEAQNVANTEFFGAHTPVYRNSGSGRSFPHLEQINSLSDTQQGAGVVIAIIDTGVYYNHPHLSPNILTNPNESHGSNGNARDDDGNGLIDDYAGWDFYNGDPYPIDDNGHGTHVAGLAASTFMGVAPRAKILPIKVLSSAGGGDLGTITAGILYALDRGADVINLSLGGGVTTVITNEIRELINSVKLANNKNAIVIAAAGNGGNDGVGDCNDEAPVYPANIQSDNLVTVASVNRFDQITSYSNFGAGSVHVAAPGGDTFTGALFAPAIAFCNGRCSSSNVPYTGMIGTSMATPVVAGMAAVLKGAKSSLSPKQIKELISNSGDYKSNLDGLVQSSSVVNMAQALNSL